LSELHRIDIPDEAKATKPWFDARPSDELVSEIKEFISTTCKPYLWRGHTHTKPPEGAVPFYLEEFSLPKRCKRRETWSPCPCCCPDTPKYRENGKIAWFPDERVIRLIGPDCFSSLNLDAHDEALARLRREQQERRDTEYLLRHFPRLLQLAATVQDFAVIAKDCDDFFPKLSNRIEIVLGIRFWHHVRSGELMTTQQVKETVVDRHGRQSEHVRDTQSVYARIPVPAGLNPERKAQFPRFEKLLQRIRQLCEVEDVSALSGDEKRRLARRMSTAVDHARRYREEMLAELNLLRPETFNTLRTWSRLPTSPVRIAFRRDISAILVGRGEEELLRVAIPEHLDYRLAELPQMGSSTKGNDLARGPSR
jgi:hypothetical protein